MASVGAEPYRILPDTGWVSLYIRNESDVLHAINLLKRSLDLAR